ncbi:hypothetical protein [Paenibacillus oenotherae]|nr:hypothetical protein [Paenibacillus oenotherae]
MAKNKNNKLNASQNQYNAEFAEEVNTANAANNAANNAASNKAEK